MSFAAKMTLLARIFLDWLGVVTYNIVAFAGGEGQEEVREKWRRETILSVFNSKVVLVRYQYQQFFEEDKDK